MPVNGTVSKIFRAIALLMFLVPPQKLVCQEGILDSVFTFRAGSMKTVNALGIITRKRYHFTYDSRLVNPEKRGRHELQADCPENRSRQHSKAIHLFIPSSTSS
ncbi:MAG: hypothetical protein IPI69_16285 [Bacteroidales bacterium]|nr:hypothetical protein [Bacteroidales bacterium]